MAQQALDTAWATTVQDAVSDHAERIDACVHEIKASKRGIKAVEDGLAEAIQATNFNLKDMTVNIKGNDQSFKKAVEDNDAALKKAVEDNDAALKTALEANDVYVKAALEAFSGRIESLVKAMAEEVDSVVKTVRTQPSRDEMGRAIHGRAQGATLG